MAPTLFPGDWLITAEGARIRPGDIIVLRRPDRPELLVVKRAVGRTRAGAYWVEGDNAAASDDSRTFGGVLPTHVEGRVLVRYWPPRRIGRRGFDRRVGGSRIGLVRR